MAKIDTLTKALYKLIHRLAGDTTTTDAQIESKIENMSFVEGCETLIEEVSDGDLALANGASTLATLNDTTITSASDGQVLAYDGTAGKWKNADPSGGGGVFLATATNSDGTYSVDKTSTEIYEAFGNGMLPILIDASGLVFQLTKAVESLSYLQVRFEQTYVEDGEGVTTESYNIQGGSEGDTVTHETATFVGSVE